ncbi:hypothetical protein BKA70DRAFT_744001, partial [Coprinopsis sp. MPI-PUGE-AT-0042]
MPRVYLPGTQPGPNARSVTSDELIKIFSSTPPTSILASARKGELGPLSVLHFALRSFRTSGPILSALDIYLSFLNSSLVPSIEAMLVCNPKALEDSERGLESIRGVECLLQHVACVGNSISSSLSHQVSAKLEGKVDALGDWFLFVTRPSSWNFPGRYQIAKSNVHYMIFIGAFVVTLLSFSSKLGRAVRKSEHIADALVQAWLLQNCDMDFKEAYGVEGPLADRPGTAYFVTIFPKSASQDNTTACCSFIAAFTQILEDKGMKDQFLSRWTTYFDTTRDARYSGSDPFVVLGETILSRLSQVRMSNQQESCSAIFAWKSLAYLEDLFVTLVGGPLDPFGSDVHPLVAYLEKADYLYHFTNTILSISNRIYAEDLRNGFRDPVVPLVLVLLQLYENMLKGQSLTRRFRDTVCSLLRGGCPSHLREQCGQLPKVFNRVPTEIRE